MNAHAKSLSVTTTAKTQNFPSFGRPSGENIEQLVSENQLLIKELSKQRQQFQKLKKEMLGIYEENLLLKNIMKSGKESMLVAEFEAEIKNLRKTIEELQQKSYSRASQREELKDRIIMKLEDQLIAAKIQVKEAHYQNPQFTTKVRRH